MIEKLWHLAYLAYPKVAILVACSLIVVAVVNVLFKNTFVWKLLPTYAKRHAAMLVSLLVYCIVFLGGDIFYVIVYSFLSTWVAFWIAGHQKKYEKYREDKLKQWLK